MRRKSILMSLVVMALGLVLCTWLFSGAKRGWDGYVQAPLKKAQKFAWSAPDDFFTGRESGNIKYLYENDSFQGIFQGKGCLE